MSFKRLSCEKARNICIVDTLAKLGHFPSRTTEKEAWFLSPLRSETQASFKVSFTLNRWYDFGIGKGGNVIDLVCLISKCTVGEALQFLSDELPVYSIQIPEQSPDNLSKNRILKSRPISRSLLKKYLQSRGIPLPIARSYCKEVSYECNKKVYYAIGLQNIKGGWELRNLYCKSSSSPKSYTYIKKKKAHLLVCEGMFDLLSIAVLYPKDLANSDIIVLNSLSFLPRITIHFKKYQKVQLLLDNDKAGKRCASELIQHYNNVSDQSQRYKEFKDPNLKLVAMKNKKIRES